jgi:hypothetical protein
MSSHNGKYNIYYNNNGSRMKDMKEHLKEREKTTIRELFVHFLA